MLANPKPVRAVTIQWIINSGPIPIGVLWLFTLMSCYTIQAQYSPNLLLRTQSVLRRQSRATSRSWIAVMRSTIGLSVRRMGSGNHTSRGRAASHGQPDFTVCDFGVTTPRAPAFSLRCGMPMLVREYVQGSDGPRMGRLCR